MTAGPIVAATDGSEESLRAVDWAAREAELRGLPLRIVSAAALPPRMAEHQTASGVPTVADTVVSDRDRGLAAATQRASAIAPDVLVDADGLSGSPARAIAEAGSGASMLVVGSRGMGAFTALILGSVSRYAAAHAPCPVVVVREQTTAAHPQVGVGIGDPARGVGRARVRVRGGRAAQGQPGRGARLGLGRRRQPRHVRRWRRPARTPSRNTWPGSCRPCWPTGRPATPTSRSATTSSTGTRAGPWSACRPAPTSSSSAGHAGRPPARSRRRQARCPQPRPRPRRHRPVVLIGLRARPATVAAWTSPFADKVQERHPFQEPQPRHHRAGHRAPRGCQGAEYPPVDRLHRIQRARDVAEQDLRIVVPFIQRHPGERQVTVLGTATTASAPGQKSLQKRAAPNGN